MLQEKLVVVFYRHFGLFSSYMYMYVYVVVVNRKHDGFGTCRDKRG